MPSYVYLVWGALPNRRQISKMPDTAKLDLTAIPEDLRVPVLVLVQAGEDFLAGVERQPGVLDQPGAEVIWFLREDVRRILAALAKQPSTRR